MKYDDLPEDLKDKLFSMHIHGAMTSDDEIVYREKDVLMLIGFLINNKECPHPFEKVISAGALHNCTLCGENIEKKENP